MARAVKEHHSLPMEDTSYVRKLEQQPWQTNYYKFYSHTIAMDLLGLNPVQ